MEVQVGRVFHPDLQSIKHALKSQQYWSLTLWSILIIYAILHVDIFFNPLRPNSDLSQTSHRNIKGLSVSEVMGIKNMITRVKFY